MGLVVVSVSSYEPLDATAGDGLRDVDRAVVGSNVVGVSKGKLTRVVSRTRRLTATTQRSDGHKTVVSIENPGVVVSKIGIDDVPLAPRALTGKSVLVGVEVHIASASTGMHDRRLIGCGRVGEAVDVDDEVGLAQRL